MPLYGFSKLVCADCGAEEKAWISLNFGVVLCTVCSNLHRSIGHHISQIKCLYNSYWPDDQLKLVKTLALNGSNNIWEHALLDPSRSKGRRKPLHNEPIYPSRMNFIKDKYVEMMFVYRPSKEDVSLSVNDANCQLHSSVRTASVETSLRLISLGADVNYIHPTKGTSPLHVAARSGQCLQVELLVIHGADIGCKDLNGHTAEYYARETGHEQLSLRLHTLQYEVVERMLAHVTGARLSLHTLSAVPPGGADWLTEAAHRHAHRVTAAMRQLVAQYSTSSSSCCYVSSHHASTSSSGTARHKLSSLSDAAFRDLCADLYDEINRRETEQDCAQLGQATPARTCPVPFLPVNLHLASTRNQGRQKLAHFSPCEMTTLIADVIEEMLVRGARCDISARAGGDTGQLARASVAAVEPLYDSVPFDAPFEENIYAAITQLADDQENNQTGDTPSSIKMNEMMSRQSSRRKSFRRPFTWMTMTPKKHESKVSSEHKGVSASGANCVDIADISALALGLKINSPSSLPNIEDITSRHTQSSCVMPSVDTINERTERLTRCIQKLLTTAQERRVEDYRLRISDVQECAMDMSEIFSKILDRSVRESVSCLRQAALRLSEDTSTLLEGVRSRVSPDTVEADDTQSSVFVHNVTHVVIQLAFSVAKAAKQLVVVSQQSVTH